MVCLNICGWFFGCACGVSADRGGETLCGPVTRNNDHGPSPADGRNDHDRDGMGDGYESVVPLPRYTRWPTSVHEKTLEMHMQDGSLSFADYNNDEKRHSSFDDSEPFPSYKEDVASDTSSAISFPSSYGNTSTATRETPPPPYSPEQSPPGSPAVSATCSIVPPDAAHVVGPSPFDLSNGNMYPRRSITGESWPRRFS